jgi:mRNA-degrading endonuclease toxin of MazEF toxin-antitoxin module
MKRGEIWFVDLEPTMGREMASDGPRPVLVVTSNGFSEATGLAWVIPITGGIDPRGKGFAISLMGFGLKTDGVLACEQMRVLDMQVRNARYAETISPVLMEQVLGTLDEILSGED